MKYIVFLCLLILMSCKEENAIPFDFDVKENEMPTVILSIPCNADEGFVDLRKY